ncbi:hypothetical protein IWX90DRAFT_414267 [Phyllosticta citrichinensis]|uniref:F-box domain-containing protein n=1 Tax=Phyllosticta citrichinensis TaxID=1130410 RepID=A0ABR1XWS9_9PEZI
MSQHDIATLAQVVTLKSLGLLSDSEITYRTGVSSDAIHGIYEIATQRGFDPRTTRTITKRHLAPSMSAQALPVRVQLLILSHLPLASLIKMHCVSRHWRNLIDSQLDSRKSPISSSRRALLQIYLEAVNQPFFIASRKHVLPHVRPFDRQEYVAALARSFGGSLDGSSMARLPEDFLTWLLEWPSSAVIGMLWPGIDSDFGSIPPTPRSSFTKLHKPVDRERRSAAVARWYRAGYRNKLPDPSRLLSSPRPCFPTSSHVQDLDPWPTPPPTPPITSPNSSCRSSPTTATAPPLFFPLPPTAGAAFELELERFIQTTESSPQMRSVLVLSPATLRSPSHSAPTSPPETPSPASPVSTPPPTAPGSTSYFPAPGTCQHTPNSSTSSSSGSGSTFDGSSAAALNDAPKPKPGRVYAQVCGAPRTIVFASWTKYLEAKLRTVEAFWDEWGRREEAAALYADPHPRTHRDAPPPPAVAGKADDVDDGVAVGEGPDVWVERQVGDEPSPDASPQRADWIGREVSGMQAFGVAGGAERPGVNEKRVAWGAETRLEYDRGEKEVQKRWRRSWRWRLGWEVGKWRAKRLVLGVAQG